MKAKVNGVELEGTPTEIYEYMKLSFQPNFKSPPSYPSYPTINPTSPPWKWNEITCIGGTTSYNSETSKYSC